MGTAPARAQTSPAVRDRLIDALAGLPVPEVRKVHARTGGLASARRRQRYAADLQALAYDLLPEHFDPVVGASPFHLDAFGVLGRATAQRDAPMRVAIAAPRGHAKSTIAGLALPLACLLHPERYDRRFILLVRETHAHAVRELGTLRYELEHNEAIRALYGDLVTEEWRQDEIVTATGVLVKAVGAGDAVRGLKWRSRRPDLAIVDDLENDEQVLSSEQRRKLRLWFSRALLAVGDARRGLDVVVVGTVLHYDSLLRWLVTSAPGWTRRTYRAVLSWPDALDTLWREWEAVYAADESEDKGEARAFYESRRAEMDAGAEVLWPGGDSLYANMLYRAQFGPGAHAAEKQNEPRDAETALIDPDWIRYWEGQAPAFAQIVTVFDPALGKPTGDYQAVVTLGRTADSLLYVLRADLLRQPLDTVEEHALRAAVQDHASVLVAEDDSMERVRADLHRLCVRRGVVIGLEGRKQSKSKRSRLVTLQPLIRQGAIRFRRGEQRLLIDQLLALRADGTSVDHDDGPDALEMAKDRLGYVAAHGARQARPGANGNGHDGTRAGGLGDFDGASASSLFGGREALTW